MTDKKEKYKSSFGIIRSNPRISGNVKITVDASENLWLNSIDSNDEMSKNQYKGFKISSDTNYAQDVYNFFLQGKTPSNFIFGLKNEDRLKDTYTNTLADQYDGFYHAGATPLISDVYNENFTYLAPFWLGKKIPKYFVIFRIDDPIDFSYVIKVTSLEVGKIYKVLEDYDVDPTSSNYTKYTISSAGTQYSAGEVFTAASTSFDEIQGSGNIILIDAEYNTAKIGNIQEHFVENILPKSSIVSTYSLQENSKIGRYLRRIQNFSNYSQSLIDVRFEKDSLTTYSGASIKDGVFANKGEYLYDIFGADSNIIDFEEYITDGFRRNGIVSYNLLNLEFLFDDPDADLYSINRYFGLYVDDIPTGNFQISGDLFYNQSTGVGNFPEPKSSLQISKMMTSPFYQENKDGIRIFVETENVWGHIPTSEDVHVNDRLKILYVKDKKDKFYSFKQIKDYSGSATDNDKWGFGTSQDNLIILKNKNLDLSSFSGADPEKTKEYKAELAKDSGRSYSILRIEGELTPNNAIVLYHPFGQYISGNKRYDYFVASDMTYVKPGWGVGSFTDESGAYYFHPFGSKEKIAEAIAGVLNRVNYKSYRAFNIGNEIVIRTEGSDLKNDEIFSVYIYDDYYNQIDFTSADKIFINDIDSIDLTVPYEFIGGSKYHNTRIKLKNEDAAKITTSNYIKTNSGLSKIKFIGKCIDEDESELSTGVIKDYFTHSILEIEDHTHTILFGSLGTIIVEQLIEVETGAFSIYSLKDLDIDFWSSTYGRTPTEEYYRYVDIQPETDSIRERIDYAVASDAIVRYNGLNYGQGATAGFIFRGNTGVTSYTLIQSSSTSRCNVVPSLYVNSIDDAINNGINDPLVDIDRFPGFVGLQEIKYLNDGDEISTKKEQMEFGKAVNEYDVLKENYQRGLTLKSRINPYITKWVYEGGIDARGNEYRLNSSNTFTPLNFSPSFFSSGRDPLYFTNEWYVLEKVPIDATSSLLKNTSSYCPGPSGGVSLSNLQNADPSSRDYFEDYFTVDGEDYYSLDNVRFSDVRKKPVESFYTYFDYNQSSGYSETLFRGVKVRIKERTDFSVQTSNRNSFKFGDQKFKDYKFTCVLKSIDDPDPYTVNAPITFRVHQNDQFKTVTLLITVVNNDSRFIDSEKFTSLIYNSGTDANASFSSATGSWYYNPTGIYGGSDYFGLYSLKNKVRHSIRGGIGTTEYGRGLSGGVLFSEDTYIKLSSGLNYSSRGTIGILPFVNFSTANGTGIVPIASNPDYDTDLREEVKFYSPVTPVTGAGSRDALKLDGIIYPYTLFSPRRNTPGTYLMRAPWPVGTGKNYLNFNEVYYGGGTGYYFNYSSLGYAPPTFTEVPIPVPYTTIQNVAVYQSLAGENYWDSVFTKISFPEIYKLFREDSRYIKYTRSYWDRNANQTVIDSNTFVLEFVKPSSFLQTTRKLPIEETVKPEDFSSTLVGYQIAEEDALTEFFRYGGGYSPKFRDVLHFNNVKNDLFSYDRNTTGGFEFTVKLNEKTKNSSFYGVGSNYEILIDGSVRKKLRLVRGNTYYFNFENFAALGYSASPDLFPIKKNFVLSSVENSGNSSDLYTEGFYFNSGLTGAYFTVPQDAPENLYYEIQDEGYSGSLSIFTEGLEYKNVTLGVNKEFFGFIRNTNYYKYSKNNPFRIDPKSGYKPEYNLIGETPIDKRDLFMFESTWDPGRYKEYISSTSFSNVPGSKNMLEQKSFFGSKVMKTPNIIKESLQLKYDSSIADVFNVQPDLYPKYEIIWEETASEIKALLLVDRTAIKHFNNGGIGKKFYSLLVAEFGVGSETVLSDDVDEYVKLNIIPQYEAKEIGVWIKKIQKTDGIDLPPIVSNLADFDKMKNGFVKSTNNNITKRGSLQYEFRLQKDPAYDYSVAFSFLIGKI